MLYRQHVTRGNKAYSTVKDLSRIGRSLESVIFVDDLECNTKLQPENSILVRPWRGDTGDRELINLREKIV
jgi:TFIIF-interacting CTD phosphatase-like protein